MIVVDLGSAHELSIEQNDVRALSVDNVEDAASAEELGEVGDEQEEGERHAIPELRRAQNPLE